MSKLVNGMESYASVLKPWLKNFSEEYINMPLPRLTMYRMMTDTCAELKKENDIAISYYGTKISFKEFFLHIEEYAAAFSEFGVKKGDKVSFLTVSLPETLCAVYALNKIGAVCNFIDVRTDALHIREYIKKAKSNVLITLEQSFFAVADNLDELGLRLVICQTPAENLPIHLKVAFRLKSPKYNISYDGLRIIRNTEFARKGMGKSVPDVGYEPDSPAVITRTGGTTGLSKGVVLTNDSMNAIVLNFRASCMDKVPRKRSLLNFLPIGASYGIAVGVHMALCLGCEDILIPNFKSDEFDKLVWRFKPNHIIAVPAFYQKLIASPRLKNKDLSFIQTMAAGGDSANDALEDKLEEFRKKHNIQYPIAQGYGMSEASSAVSFGFQNVHKKGSAGIPSLTSVIAAFKPGTDEELPLGVEGELCISGATLMKCYLDEPEETKQVMWQHSDGTVWIHTGDIGYVDEDGFVFICGRIKRSIARFDGHKVYPLQLERIIMKHPQVTNCVALAVKDREHEQGQLPLVVVELKRGTNDTNVVRQELLKLCCNEIELRSQPADIVFVESIPTTQMVKNDYRALEDKFRDYDYQNREQIKELALRLI